MRLDMAQTQAIRLGGSVPATLEAGINTRHFARFARRLYVEQSRPYPGTVVGLPALVDQDAFRDQGDEDATAQQFEKALWNAFDAEPLEDGVTHSGEQIIAELLEETEWGLDWLRQLALNTAAPSFAASMLRCLSRANISDASWQAHLVRDVLAQGTVQMRDAALQAAEQWGGRQLRGVLESHLGAESVAWLRQAMTEIADGLRD